MSLTRTISSVLVIPCLYGGAVFAATPSFEPIYPRSGQTDVDIGKPFTLPAVPANAFCDIVVSESNSFDAPLATRRVPAGTTSLDLRKVLSPDHDYRWQIVCRQISDTEPIIARTATLAFKTSGSSGLPAVKLERPPQGAQDISIRVPTWFTWQRVPGTRTYKLYTKGTKDKEEQSITICDPDQVNPAEAANLPWGYVQLEAGKTYHWRVEAFSNILCVKDPTPEIIAQSDERTLETPRDPAERFADAGFKLQRAFTLIESEEKGDPATFGFLAQTGSKPIFSTEFALLWKGGQHDLGPNARFYPMASVEARLHSGGDEKQNDAVKARLTGDFHIVNTNPSFREFLGSHVLSSLKYETDHKADTKKVMLELLWAPSVRGKIGQELPHVEHYTGRDPGGLREFAYIWQPYLGLDAGRTTTVGKSLEDGDAITRAVVRVTGRLSLLGLAERLNVTRITIFADDYYRYLWHTSNQRGNNYLEVGTDFYLTENVSIALRGSIGRDAPDFAFARSFGINLGLKVQ